MVDGCASNESLISQTRQLELSREMWAREKAKECLTVVESQKCRSPTPSHAGHSAIEFTVE